MKRREISLLVFMLIFVFILVYSPHFNYRFPYFIDEWHHISQSYNLFEGGYFLGSGKLEIGFQLFLRILSSIIEVLRINFFLFYKFLPALWAVFSALILFYAVEKKTNNFYIGILAVILFASIKSNSDIGGLWFFTPLTFSIPFIFLYIYFFTEGIEKRDNKMVLWSLGIMIFLLPIHAISVLFAIPILLIYCLFHLKYIKSEWKFFPWFLVLPVFGVLFYVLLTKNFILYLFKQLQFRLEFGYADLPFSFFDVYPLVGFVLALFGVIFIMLYKNDLKKYILFIIWPIYLLFSIFIFKLFGVSLFSPYQRNIYYFVLSLPILSAFGVIYLLQLIRKIKISEFVIKIIFVIFIMMILFFTFYQYYDLPEKAQLRQIIDEDDYKDLLFLRSLDKGVVLAEPLISNAILPISGKFPITTSFVLTNRKEVERFFGFSSCDEKNEIIDNFGVDYILTKEKTDCGWELIYEGKNFIYVV